MSESLSELYAECESALRLYRFMHKAYGNLVDNCPERLVPHVHALNVFLFAELHRTLVDELTGEETAAFCAFIEGLREYNNGTLF
jgi:hypothetical protein